MQLETLSDTLAPKSIEIAPQFQRSDLYPSLGVFLLWYISVNISPIVFIPISILSLLFFFRKEMYAEVLFSVVLMSIFSDSRESSFFFTRDYKNFYFILALLIIFSKSQLLTKSLYDFIKPFMFFFIIAFLALFNSLTLVTGLLKTISYALVLVVIPGIVWLVIKEKRKNFAIKFLWLNYFFVILSVFLYLTGISQIVLEGSEGRFRGHLGNPNGLGLYVLLLFLFVALSYYQKWLSKKEFLFFLFISFFSIYLTGSRNSLFSIVLFFILLWAFKRSMSLSIIAMIFGLVIYDYLITFSVQLFDVFNLEQAVRIDTLLTGGGRFFAYDFAWTQIQDSYWFGKGFNYTEFLVDKYAEYLASNNSVGNLHNSFLTLWLDTGLTGVILFLLGWVIVLRKLPDKLIIYPIFFTAMFSAYFASWLAGSQNPYTPLLLAILALGYTSNSQ